MCKRRISMHKTGICAFVITRKSFYQSIENKNYKIKITKK
jgi:hypothetical protein